MAYGKWQPLVSQVQVFHSGQVKTLTIFQRALASHELFVVGLHIKFRNSVWGRAHSIRQVNIH